MSRWSSRCSAGRWWCTQTRARAPKPHDPVSVLIADFQNGTNDPTFDHTLEQTLRRALEGAGFISAYDRSRIRGAFGVQPPEKLDEMAARELAVKQGSRRRACPDRSTARQRLRDLGQGRADGDGQGRRPPPGAAPRTRTRSSAPRTKLATTVRKALGDETSARISCSR